MSAGIYLQYFIVTAILQGIKPTPQKDDFGQGGISHSGKIYSRIL
jgi:hypothetical protein